jgi:hypothetical protein
MNREARIVKTKFFLGAISLITLLALAATASAQKKAGGKSAPSLLAALPQSDVLAVVNVRLLLDQALPKMLAENPGKLAEVNAELDRFKTKTGIDPRSFEQVALGMRYTYPTAGISKIESVVLARGTFNAATFVAAGRIAANGKYREEKHQGRTIYVFTLAQQMKIFGLLNLKVNDLAVTALSNNVLALGTLATVKSAINAGKGPKGQNQELIALAERDPNAAIGFGGNVTPQLLQSINLSNEAIVKDISTIRQVYGTIGVTEKDVEMFVAARTLNLDSAKNLGQTLEGLKQLAAFFVGRLPAVAKTALDNLKITTQGNELQIRTAVAQAEIAPLLRGE